LSLFLAGFRLGLGLKALDLDWDLTAVESDLEVPSASLFQVTFVTIHQYVNEIWLTVDWTIQPKGYRSTDTDLQISYNHDRITFSTSAKKVMF